ncbi:MAG: response regulator [Candidatus Eremiobacteraeota bacterium]|nr:response regulator [Candidatus Eremiobacteraeota bacterium]
MNKKILIIENSPDFFNILAIELKHRNYELVVTSDGFDAFRKAQKENPDLILIDVVLPKLDGLSVCKLIKAKPTMKMIPVIITTSIIGENINHITNRAKADVVIERKNNHKELISIIEEFLTMKETPEAIEK